MDSQRAILDELMGKDRDLPPGERTGRTLKFSDPSVCKFQVAGLCPNMLFKNTKSDLGLCQYEVHEDHIDWEDIKKQWSELSEQERLRYGYERDLLRLLEQHIRDMDRKIAKAKERAEKESAPRELKGEDRERLAEIQLKIKESLEKSQTLGEEGDVDGSMMFAQQAESFKQQHDSLKRSLTQPERTMTVCEICGVFINSTDNEQRKKASLDHLNGKQYLGWKRIREEHKLLVDKFDRLKHEREVSRDRDRDRDDRAPRDRRSDRGRDERRRDRSRDRSRDRARDRSRDRARDRSRDHYRRRRSPSPRRRSPYSRSYKASGPSSDDHRRRRHEDYGYRY
ncbi:unnamed protein product [Ostreobium quekettii]|uniref:Uncharacterized protein n=1 Tax=Ostreobium quekettii TaxID=121088 RepID=A0A8S1ILH5_9CHLO|nr:unnamed protein product [Ostreobium quekettii]